jgi:hypothetical protein
MNTMILFSTDPEIQRLSLSARAQSRLHRTSRVEARTHKDAGDILKADAAFDRSIEAADMYESFAMLLNEEFHDKGYRVGRHINAAGHIWRVAEAGNMAFFVATREELPVPAVASEALDAALMS